MTNTKLATFIVLGVAMATQVVANEKYPVSPMVTALQLERVGDVLFRYIEFFERYPCLRIETLVPASRKLIARRDVCKFRVENLLIDTRTDVAAVFFQNFEVKDNGFNFDVDLSLSRAGAHYLNCRVAISDDGKLPEPSCKEGKRPPEPNIVK